MDQFTAKGCFFLRNTDINVQYSQYTKVNVGEMRGLNLDRKKIRMRDRKARHRHEQPHLWGPGRSA